MIYVRITQATLADLPRLQSIARETFQESFAAMNSEANIRAYMDEAFSAEKLAAELAEENSTFYLATMDDEVIGYLKINSGNAQTEPMGDSALEIERIYVRKAYHGRQVGQRLLDKAIEVAREMNIEQVWLGVWKENARAIRFYEKNGFTPFGTHVFLMGDDPQTDILMRCKVER
jgi:ribosomal protein S18 acetylase RimI-like enzyme